MIHYSVENQLHDLITTNLVNFAKYIHSKYTIYDKEDEQELDKTDIVRLAHDYSDLLTNNTMKDKISSTPSTSTTTESKRGRKPKGSIPKEVIPCDFLLTKGKRSGSFCGKPASENSRCKNHELMNLVVNENENEKKITPIIYKGKNCATDGTFIFTRDLTEKISTYNENLNESVIFPEKDLEL